MAKLGLIFVCVFLMVQWSSAARLVRDAPVETPTKAEGSEYNFNDALTKLTQQFQATFSKENLDRVMGNLGETGEKFKEFGQSLITKAQATAADLANSANKKDEKST